VKIRKHAKPLIAAGLCLAVTGTSLFISACNSAVGVAPSSAANRWEASSPTPSTSMPSRQASPLSGRSNSDAALPNDLDYPSDWPKATYSRGVTNSESNLDGLAYYAHGERPLRIGEEIDRSTLNTTELLIIERRQAAHRAQQDTLGCGGLITTIDEKQVTVPLKHTNVKASIAGYISAVNVTQQFTNPYSSKIEAVYVFPLPENAAISDFIMTIGDRHIRGIIREREQAEQIYAQARAQGHTASLLTQERPNIFTQKVANIEPGKQIDINITYYSTLTYSDGGYEFTFPMVVGPRFNPPGTTDPIHAAPRNNPAQPNTTEITYLRPTERTGHDISLSLDIDAGVSM
jgi:hypothetical protein